MAEFLISCREVRLAEAAIFSATGCARTRPRSTAWTDLHVQWAAGKQEGLSDGHKG